MNFYGIIIALIWFYFANRKIIRNYPVYSGKYLWTFCFFPIAFFVSAIACGLDFLLMFIDKGISSITLLWSLACFLLSIFLYRGMNKINTEIISWNNHSQKNIISYFVKILILWGILGIGNTFVFYYTIFNMVVNSSNLQDAELAFHMSEWQYNNYNIIYYIVMLCILSFICWCIYRAALRRVELLPSEFGFKEIQYPTSHQSSSVKSKKDLSYENLRELKKLYDDGILSEEEFNKLKREILNNN